LALKHVGAIHPGRRDANSHLSGPRNGHWVIFGAKHLRTPEIGKSDNYHKETPKSAVMDSYY
jgi:hypothetical protein